MESDLVKKVIEVLKSEPKGAAALLVSKKLGITLVEARRVLGLLVERGIVEKKGNTYRLK